MGDEQIVCADCGRSFTWSYGEQRFYKARDLSPPKRCETCRARRRSDRAAPKRSAPSATRKPTAGARRAPAARRAPGNPYRRYYRIGFGAALGLTILLWLGGFVADLVTAWLVAINVATLALFGYDKASAQGKRQRVPERVLLVLALSFGALGALVGMVAFRHKTAKMIFQIKFWLVVVVQALLVWAYFALVASL